MSHSVFRDFDDEKLKDATAKSEIADQNVIVFINKDGGVTVDQSALQDLIGECAIIASPSLLAFSTIDFGSFLCPLQFVRSECKHGEENYGECDSIGLAHTEHGIGEIDTVRRRCGRRT